MKLKTILGYAAIAFTPFFVLKNPTGAAHVTNIRNSMASMARGSAAFFTSL